MSVAYSMTGYARVSGRVHDQLGFTVSLKGVNHRFPDLHLRLPSNCDALEMQLRQMLKGKLRRGHVELTLQLERQAQQEIAYDRALVAAYVKAFREAAKEHGIKGEPDLNAVFRLPGALAENSSSTADTEAIEKAVLEAMDGLLAQFNAMRAQEGAALVAELRGNMRCLQAAVEEVSSLREEIRQAYFSRMNERITELLQGSPVNEERILAEAAVLAERSSVEEELVRLRTHIEHFQGLLDQGGELGKKLDFLLQEFHRETNTLLSKTSGLMAGNGLRITELGLSMKSEIEKVKEQVQNLE